MTFTETLNKVQMPLTSAALSVLLIRLFLAYEWINSGTGKIRKNSEHPCQPQPIIRRSRKSLRGMGEVKPYPFMTDFLTNALVPNTPAFITMVAICEVLVGLSLLLGLLTRIGALGGIILSTIFYLAAGHTSPLTAGINLVMIGAQLGMMIAPGGRVLGLDALLHRKFTRVPLW